MSRWRHSAREKSGEEKYRSGGTEERGGRRLERSGDEQVKICNVEEKKQSID